jgi:ubiquinone/menaquinone biosynthesis C-methylase UbiE
MIRTRIAALLLLTALCAPVAAKRGIGHRSHVPTPTAELVRRWESPERAAWQMPDRVVGALALKPGQAVADIGAGSGYFAVRFAAAVGAQGRVFAVDIDRELMDHVAKRAKDEKLAQLVAHAGRTDSPALPDASIDVAFICDTLHHIDEPSIYLGRLKPALKAGGRLAVVEYKKIREKHGPPYEHRMSKADIVKVAERGGFKLVREHDFLPRQTFFEFEPVGK